MIGVVCAIKGAPGPNTHAPQANLNVAPSAASARMRGGNRRHVCNAKTRSFALSA